MNARKWITDKATYGLVIMSVVFAVVGFTTAEKSLGQVIALTASLALFSWLLSEALETYLEHRKHNSWRQHPALGLGAFALAVEIHLVHFGMSWMFPELSTTAHYLISAGFSSMTVFSKAAFGYVYPEETVELQGSTLADVIETTVGKSIDASVSVAA